MKNKNQRMLFTALGLGVVLLILCKDEIADVISSPNNGGSDTPTTGGGKGTPTPVGDSSPCGCNPLTDRNCHCSPQGGDALPSPPNDKGEVKFPIGGDNLSSNDVLVDYFGPHHGNDGIDPNAPTEIIIP